MLIYLHVNCALKRIFASIYTKNTDPWNAGVLIGTAFNLTGMTHLIPKFIGETLHMISQACIFISLFTVGAALYGHRITMNRVFAFNMMMKCIANGFIALGIVTLFHIHGNDAKELVLLLAMPTATIATIFALQWQIETREAISVYLESTLCSIITLPLFINIMS